MAAEGESIRQRNREIKAYTVKRKGEGNYKCGGLRGRDRVRDGD